MHLRYFSASRKAGFVAAVSDLALILLAPIELASVILSSELRGSCQIFTSVIPAYELEVEATTIPQQLPMFSTRAEFCFKSLIASGQRLHSSQTEQVSKVPSCDLLQALMRVRHFYKGSTPTRLRRRLSRSAECGLAISQPFEKGPYIQRHLRD